MLHADEQSVASDELLQFSILQPYLFKRVPRTLDLDRLIEPHLYGGASSRIDAEIRRATTDLNKGKQPDQHQCTGHRK